MPRKRPRTKAGKKRALRLREEARNKRLGRTGVSAMIMGKK
jgi:hypothetical protein